uniref:CCR4-NOT transcription complex subunit 9 n=1 Tax=Bos taurus TaxID=9913 RepID=A0ABI0P627_BOVIN
MHSLATAAPVPTALAQVDREKIYQWINELSSPETRENALLELSKKRESVPDLAPMLWHSFGTIAALLQEIVNIYPSINPPTLTAHQSNRVCNALALLQCVASHPETRSAFLAAHIPLFLYPFLHTVSKTRPFEYLRLTSLGVIGALVKTDEQEVINFLLTTEIIPLCLRIMESGSELSKTVATFILQKILLDDTGLAYICQTYERFSHVAMILVTLASAGEAVGDGVSAARPAAHQSRSAADAERHNDAQGEVQKLEEAKILQTSGRWHDSLACPAGWRQGQAQLLNLRRGHST